VGNPTNIDEDVEISDAVSLNIRRQHVLPFGASNYPHRCHSLQCPVAISVGASSYSRLRLWKGFEEMKSYIVLVAQDGDQRKQWAIRVDRLLIGLAVGVLCSLSVIALPLFQRPTPQVERWAKPTPAHETHVPSTPRSGRASVQPPAIVPAG
jgi:hypothetical protein